MADLEVTQVIYDYQTLREMINKVGEENVYQLGCNIDCSESAKDGGWKSFDFKGTLIGGGYAICNLTMNNTGFFNTLYGNVSGVGFINCTIKDATNTGILCKEINCGNNLVERCYVENSLILPYGIGGMFKSQNVGGLASRIKSGTVKECYVANTVIGQENSKISANNEEIFGGFIAWTEGGLICDCYTQNCTIYCYNTGGGFVANNNYDYWHDKDITGIRRCYASSRVILRNNKSVKGGFCANANQIAIEYQEGNFYNLDVFGINNGQGYGYAKITEQMKDIETFQAEKWEFSIVNEDGTVNKKTWRIEDGLTYPYLQFNKQYKDIVPQSFLKVRNTDNEDLYAPLVSYNDVNLKGTPHLFIRV